MNIENHTDLLFLCDISALIVSFFIIQILERDLEDGSVRSWDEVRSCSGLQFAFVINSW
ncbi:hypothetical protein DM02DRAFT_614404 [Periconia macrospinosa]|uniref:Uncharacterized protein n=1 Tax=Periconia macrospinosa TaxID=97972 RepID=A0A2V1DQC2_9PLEO|nr:hypothetical protein DM02DRAFT_614404 [Periconia macrospinosa]